MPTTNGLPPHLSAEKVPEAKPEWRHQWLYSVVPISYKVEDWEQDDGKTKLKINYPLQASLVGYCRNCGKAFSQTVKTLSGGGYFEQVLDVPQTGCVGPA